MDATIMKVVRTENSLTSLRWLMDITKMKAWTTLREVLLFNAWDYHHFGIFAASTDPDDVLIQQLTALYLGLSRCAAIDETLGSGVVPRCKGEINRVHTRCLAKVACLPVVVFLHTMMTAHA